MRRARKKMSNDTLFNTLHIFDLRFIFCFLFLFVQTDGQDVGMK